MVFSFLLGAWAFGPGLATLPPLPVGITRQGSPHYGDQLQLFSDKKLRDAYFYREDVLKHVKSREVLIEGSFGKH